MKRAVEYTAVDDNGAPLKKHNDDPDARIAHIRQAITKHHQQLATLERELDDAYKAREMAVAEKTSSSPPNASPRL
jgi:uncharacterized coiled-coil DUF342 family protein